MHDPAEFPYCNCPLQPSPEASANDFFHATGSFSEKPLEGLQQFVQETFMKSIWHLCGGEEDVGSDLQQRRRACGQGIPQNGWVRYSSTSDLLASYMQKGDIVWTARRLVKLDFWSGWLASLIVFDKSF